MAISPVLAAMTSVTGAVTRFLHVWPYKSFDERARLRAKAAAEGVWPPPGGPGHLVSQQVDIYLPAAVLADEVGTLPPVRKQPIRSEPRAVAQA